MYKVRACFEVKTVSCEGGKLVPRLYGLQICLGESVKEWPYEDMIAHVDINKVADMILVDPAAITIITPQQYDERYGDKK